MFILSSWGDKHEYIYFRRSTTDATAAICSFRVILQIGICSDGRLSACLPVRVLTQTGVHRTGRLTVEKSHQPEKQGQIQEFLNYFAKKHSYDTIILNYFESDEDI